VLSRYSLFPGVIVACAIVSGCAHPTGYVDIHSRVTPLGQEKQFTLSALSNPISVTGALSGSEMADYVLHFNVESIEVTESVARRDAYGKRTDVAWQWYHPLLKIPVALTIIPPFFISMHDPHVHGDGGWKRRDFFRDVIAWYNLCSAIPTGSRRIDLEEKLIRSEVIVAPIEDKVVPVEGREVSVELDGKPISKAVSDAKGKFDFDMQPFLTEDFAKRDHELRLITYNEKGARQETTMKISGATFQKLLDAKKQ
jgi:hypothetical protein